MQKEENNLENILFEKFANGKGSSSQGSTGEKSLINISKEDMVLESDDSGGKNDTNVIQMHQINQEKKDETDEYIKDLEENKDLNDIKSEQYVVAMECESHNEKEVEEKEDNKVNTTLNTLEIKKFEEDPFNKKEEIGDNNNAITNQTKKEENLIRITKIKKVKKKPLFKVKKNNKRKFKVKKYNKRKFKVKKYNKRKRKTKCNKDINTNTICYENTNGDLSIPETQEKPDDSDERLNLTELHFSSNAFPFSNIGGSEALFAIYSSNYPRNIPFYDAMDNYCDRETNFKSIFK